MDGRALADGRADARWRKSSQSGGNGGNCVEVGQATTRVVLVRDTADRDGPLLVFPADAWRRFTRAVH